jgi:FAD:protein FMN transferase
MQSLEFRAMNTAVLLATEEQNGAGTRLAGVRALIEDYERRFSRFLPDSELSSLNAAAGERWVEVSDDLFELLALSKAYHLETHGLFDPAVLADLKRAGYDVTFDEVRARDPSWQGNSFMGRPRSEDFSAVELEAGSHKVWIPEGLQIDLGGIAKGWIIERAAMHLKIPAGAGAASAGGDIFFAGVPQDGTRWRVEIEDPREAQKTVAVLELGEGAVVTSSISKRKWSVQGQTRHHIIDPRTGEPAQTEWLSATVIAPHGDLAEAYAKALLIGGRSQAAILLSQRPAIAAVCVGLDGQVSASANSKEYLNDHYQLLQ